MIRREFTPPVRDGDAPPKARPFTAPGSQRPTSALATKATAETTFHLPAASGLLRRPASAFPPATRPGRPASALSTGRPASALSTGKPASALSTGRPASALSTGTSSGMSQHKPVLPLHIDEAVFQSQKYAASSPAEVYAGMPLVEKDLETNLMVNFVRHGRVPAQPPPEMSMGFLEPRSQDSQGVQRKVAKCIRNAAAMRSRGEVEAALAEYTQMLKLYPHDYDIMSSLGTMLCRVGETAMALKALSKACQCKPSSAVAFYNLGCAHIHHIQRQPSSAPNDIRAAPALRAFDQCVSLAPTAEALAARALCKRLAGDFLGATADYSASKSAVSAFAMSKEAAPQLHKAWREGSKLLASTLQLRKDAERESERVRRREATSEVERKQRVLKDLFVDPFKRVDVKPLDSSSDGNGSDGNGTPNETATKTKGVGWASDSSSSDDEGRAVAAAVDEDYLSHYSSVASSTAVSGDAHVLLTRSKAIEKLEASKRDAQASAKSISRIREVADSVATVADHEAKLKQAAGASVSFQDVESPRSAQPAALLLAPSDTVKRFRARQRWHVCRQFMRAYGPVAVPAHRRSHRHTSKVVDMLKRFEFLSRLPPYILQQIAQCVKTRAFDCGDVIIRQGSAGTSLFIIMMGNVDVSVHFGEPKQAVLSLAKRVAGFAAGQAFGETAFTSAAPRSAFCVAASYVAAAELLKEDFDRIKKAYETTQTNIRIESLKPLLFVGSDLDHTQLERMAKTMTPFATPPGATVLAQGEKCATMFYITEGQVSFFRRPANGQLRATAVALQSQFEMEERSNALDAAAGADTSPQPAAPFAGKMRPLSAAQRRNAFLEMSALMGIDPHEDPQPSLTKQRKIELGKKLLYAAQLGTCESQARGAAEAASSSSAGAVALEAMGKVDALDVMLVEAADAQVALPEGRVFEDSDHANKLVRQHGAPIFTLHAPFLLNHEGVVCCSDRKGFSGASLFTAVAPVHCTGYQIIRSHFQTCGPNIENIVEENFVQRLKDMCAAVARAIEWRRFKNSLMKQYQLKGTPTAASRSKRLQ